MWTLIEKDKKLQELLDSIPETQRGTEARQEIAKAIEKAYKSGFLKFNALDHTMDSSSQRIRWVDCRESFFNTGLSATLVRSYLIENGYINEGTVPGKQRQDTEGGQDSLPRKWWQRLLGMGDRSGKE